MLWSAPRVGHHTACAAIRHRSLLSVEAEVDAAGKHTLGVSGGRVSAFITSCVPRKLGGESSGPAAHMP